MQTRLLPNVFVILAKKIICPLKLCGLVASWLGLGLATPKVAGSTSGLALSANNPGQVVHTHVPASVTKQYNLLPVKRR